MIQNVKHILKFKVKATNELIDVEELDFTQHKDGSVSVRFNFPKYEVKRK